MKHYIKYLLILLAVSVIVGLLTAITAPHLDSEEKPQRIPTYSEVVPSSFSAPITSSVIDVRETSTLMQPRLGIVKVADNIVAISCPAKNRQCMTEALYMWVRQEIDYRDALLARDHILSPEETLLYKVGDGLTQSILLSALLRAEGFETRLANTAYTNFLEVKFAESTVRLDVGCASCRLNQTRYNGPEDNIVWVS